MYHYSPLHDIITRHWGLIFEAFKNREKHGANKLEIE